MNDLPIISVDYGLSSRYDDGIEINRKLTGELREKIIRHERSHSSGAYSKQDYKTDFQSKEPYFLESLKFCIKNPEAFIGFFPAMYSYHYKIWTYNLTALFPFFLWGAIFSGMSYFAFKVNFWLGFMTWAWIFALMNIVLLGYTHFYVKCAGETPKHKVLWLVGKMSLKLHDIKTRIFNKFKRS